LPIKSKAKIPTQWRQFLCSTMVSVQMTQFGLP
jgi:hypothetical protein